MMWLSGSRSSAARHASNGFAGLGGNGIGAAAARGKVGRAPLETEAIGARDASKLRLANSAELATELTGTKLKLTSDTRERTDAETLLLVVAAAEETWLVLETKLRVWKVVDAVDVSHAGGYWASGGPCCGMGQDAIK